MWQLIETYVLPTEEWSYDYPKAMFYSKTHGILIGRCVLIDAEEKEYSFWYDHGCLSFKPTHWMPLPEVPKTGDEV